ncbi:MAG: hypothetical protein Q4B32_01855 [Clostridia bacterium]|nr:hypothetical protein [Clostridia bacterium]
MTNIVLTGEHAGKLVLEIAEALSMPVAGYELRPFAINGRIKGKMIHLFQTPAGEMANDIPCLLFLSDEKQVQVQEVIEELAVKALRQGVSQQALILADGLTGDLLTLPAFRQGVQACLQSPCGIVLCAEEDALPALRDLSGGCDLQVFSAEDPNVSMQLQNELCSLARKSRTQTFYW